MNLLVVIILILLGLGISHMIYTRRIGLRDFIEEPQSLLGVFFRGSLIPGAIAGMIFLGILIVVGFLDRGYTWTLQGILGMIIIALVAGLLVMLGSLWQLFIVGKYRGFLFSRLKRRQQADQTSQNKYANPKQ